MLESLEPLEGKHPQCFLTSICAGGDENICKAVDIGFNGSFYRGFKDEVSFLL